MLVRVPSAGHTGYPVVVAAGALEHLPTHLAEHAPAARYVLISDDTVFAAHGERTLALLRAAGVRSDALTVPAGEASKSREAWSELTDRMLALGCGRDSAVIALGGGVVGDLGGFVAATYMRGVPLVQAPTTLLAMIDASIGGKAGVNTASGKNLVGAFHPPRAVVTDPLVLRTLPDVELRNGLAEAVKHGAIADLAHLEWIAESARLLAERDAAALASLLEASIPIKARVVEADPFEEGERATLNFGHTVAHALEKVTAYALPHGHAVSIGMVVEAELGEAMGVTQPGTAGLLRTVLCRCGLPAAPPAGCEADAVVRAAAADKKARRGQVRVVLLQRAGTVARTAAGEWTHAADAAMLRDALLRCTAINPVPQRNF